MALSIASVPVLTGSAADRFDELLQKTEENRDKVNFSAKIAEARMILKKANFI